MRDLAKAKTVASGAMEATIYEQGEALIKVRYASVALTPKELKAFYELLKRHYEQQGKQENHG